MGKTLGFGVMQFNAVVATNLHARHLYERLGFTPWVPHEGRALRGYLPLL